MKLRHFSHRILTTADIKGARQYHADDRKHWRGVGKPRGLWVSDESEYGWRKWSTEQRFAKWKLRYEHEITLAPKARILYIRNAVQLDRFTKRYKANDTYMNNMSLEFREKYKGTSLGDVAPSVYDIDWRRVARNWHGIVITPYLWERRLSSGSDWYYGWDCASGVIWNARAIERIDMIKERQAPPKPTYWQMRRKHKRDMIKMERLMQDMQQAIRSRKPQLLEEAENGKTD